jgi:predicted ATPase with chaperone activity
MATTDLGAGPLPNPTSELSFLIGPPRNGKTILASRLPGILPPMREPEELEAAAVASVSQRGLEISAGRRRPFRAPHYSASGPALVGGVEFDDGCPL